MDSLWGGWGERACEPWQLKNEERSPRKSGSQIGKLHQSLHPTVFEHLELGLLQIAQSVGTVGAKRCKMGLVSPGIKRYQEFSCTVENQRPWLNLSTYGATRRALHSCRMQKWAGRSWTTPNKIVNLRRELGRWSHSQWCCFKERQLGILDTVDAAKGWLKCFVKRHLQNRQNEYCRNLLGEVVLDLEQNASSFSILEYLTIQ